MYAVINGHEEMIQYLCNQCRIDPLKENKEVR